MRTAHKAAQIVIVTTLALGAVSLAGCGKPSSPSAAKPTTATKATPVTPAPSTKAAPTTKPLPPGSVAVAGYDAVRVGEVARFVESFARSAMSGCGEGSVLMLESSMTPELYAASVKTPKRVVLTLEPPMVMSAGCVTSQDLSDGGVAAGPVVERLPSIRVAVTVTEGLKVSTTASPKTLKAITVTRRYTVDVLPFGKNWQATNVITSDSTVTEGK